MGVRNIVNDRQVFKRCIQGVKLIGGNGVILPLEHLFAESYISRMMNTLGIRVKNSVSIARVSQRSSHIHHLCPPVVKLTGR